MRKGAVNKPGYRRLFMLGLTALAAALAVLYGLMPLAGPLGQDVPSRGGFAESWAGRHSRPVSFGAYPINNRTGSAEEVLSVVPVMTSPRNAHWAVGVVEVPPGVGVSHLVRPGRWYRLPHTFAADHGWQPVLTLKAPGTGRTEVQGLWVTYRWRSRDYRVYTPVTFAVCIHQTSSCSSLPIAATRPKLSFGSWLQLAFR